jgi:hypothetical protein
MPTGPSCSGQNMWLIRKPPGSAHLEGGNQSPGHELVWPNADPSSVQRWLLKIDVLTKTIAKPGEPAVPLKSIELELPIVWNPQNNEFFIEVDSETSV